MLDHNCQLPMPIFLEWNRRTVFGKYIFSSNGNWNNFFPSHDCHSVLSNMRETSWHLLRLGTCNLIDVLPKPMLRNVFLWRIALPRIGQKQCCTKCVWYCKAWFLTAHFRNKFHLNLYLFQWFGPVFFSFSSPKVGICSNRGNLHMPSFLKFVAVLWIIDKHCNKIIEPATNKYFGHTPAIY